MKLKFTKTGFPGARKALPGVCVLIACLFAAGNVLSQTTNAFDQASDPAYAGLGAPNGLAGGGQNGGFGFGAWTFTVTGTGGAFIAGNGPSGNSFDLWNTSANNGTTAVRPFGSSLTPGQSFSVTIRLNSLDGGNNTNRFALEDASGNILFSYWHLGGDNANGWYSDAIASVGVATNFQYAYQQFVTYKFTLNSATTYTFTDLATGASFTGTIANAPIAKFAFIRRNANNSPGNGQDYQFDNFLVTSAAPATFTAVTPGDGSFSAVAGAPISLNVLSGGVPLNLGSATMKVDGVAVTPTVSGNSSLMSVSFTPSPALSAGSVHTAQVVVRDNNTVSYTNNWTFRTGYNALPVALPGVYTISNAQDLTIFTAAGDSWLGTNYGASSSRTFYARATMTVESNAGEAGGGGFYCGFHFFSGNSERLIFGNNWPSVEWSADGAAGGGGAPDLNPNTFIVLDEPHTLLARIDYNPAGNDAVKIWLDPDFSQTEANQPNAPITLSMDNGFDNIRLRCGNGTAAITVFSNVVVASLPTDVGFAVPAAPQFQAITPSPNAIDVAATTAIGAQVVVGGSPISAVALQLDGVTVSPITNAVSGVITVSYQPPTRLSGGALHTVDVIVTDSTSAKYTNSWSFTTGFDALPLMIAGPLDVSNNVDLVLFTAANDPWLGTNYQSSSSRTLYARFSVEFDSFGNNFTFGGLQFWQGNSERLLVAKGGATANWSVTGGGVPDTDVPPVTFFNTGEWHSFVVRADHTAGGNTAVSVWLDPDFTQTEAAQPNPPLTVSLDNTFDSIHLRAGFAPALAHFTNIVVASTSAGVGFVAPSAPTFQAYIPAQNATSASVSTPVGVTGISGTYSISAGGVSMTLDGTAVSPAITTNGGSLNISYQPPTPFAPGSSHTAVVNVTDSNNGSASTSWSFTVDEYPTLPVTFAGPIMVGGGGVGTVIWNSQNGWIDSHYGTNSTATLYTTFSMEFDSLNGETGNGGGYGGLHFYLGNSERLIIGNAWISLNWSLDAAGNQLDISSTPIVFGEWHTFVVKTVFVANASDHVKIWMDPDFSRTESGQVAPFAFDANVAFDSVHLRAGDGSASAQFSNVVMTAASPFAASVPPSVLHVSGGQLSWTSSGVLQQAPAVTGPWSDAPNQSNPQALQTTGAALFYRVRQ